MKDNELTSMVAALMQSRQTILPKRLNAPGPDPQELAAIVSSAGTAPDHGQLLPWRLVLVAEPARAKLGAVFAAALLERDASATSDQIAQAEEKAHRAPCLFLVTVDTRCGDLEIDAMERVVSAGCAIQNMLLMATAMGYASALTSGKALKSEKLRTFFGLQAGENALCFVSIGTTLARKPARMHPAPSEYVRIVT